MSMSKMEFMTEVLSDWCTLENKEFISADDLLCTDDTLTKDQRNWLTVYCDMWEVAVNE